MKKIFNAKSSTNASNDANANSSSGQNYSHFIGKVYQLAKHSVYVEDVIAEGGFSIVFLVKSNLNGKRYALKRMYVNNETDLEACKFELQIIVSHLTHSHLFFRYFNCSILWILKRKLSEHNKKILSYVDSIIQRQTSDIYEILLLTKLCKAGGLVQLMNDRLSNNSRLQENEIVQIFCDICEAVADLHANGIIHRDLKIENILLDELSDSKRQSNSNLPLNYNFVLCDFGSATKKVYDRRLNPTQSVQLVTEDIQK